VQGLNDSWRRRRLPPLTLIRGSELHPKFLALAADFWPEEPPEVRAFLTLYLSEGRGDFNHKAFADFLRRLLPESKLSKPAVARRIAAAGVFASYLLEPFHREGDHWSAFRGWVIAAAHQAWAAEKFKLEANTWHPSFLLTRTVAFASLESLATETLSPHALVPREPELDDYTRMRNTVAGSALASLYLMNRRAGEYPQSANDAIRLIQKLAFDSRFWFWGESALPHFLAMFWFLEHSPKAWMGEEFLLKVIGLLTRRNRKQSDEPLPSPEVSPDQVLSDLLEKVRHPEPRRGRRAPVSWALEPLLHLLALRMRRQALKARWYDISHVEMASFRPEHPADNLLWVCAAGEEMERLPGKPQSWQELRSTAKTIDVTALPEIFRGDRDFALMFSLVFPHRCSTNFVKSLDDWFG
jgi:hypothetical protein